MMIDPPLVAALAQFRGGLPAQSHDSRALSRATGHPQCQALPVIAALGLTPDVVAGRAYELGLGPEPDRGMSQFARQQGDQFDLAMLEDGSAVIAALVADGWLPPRTATSPISVINVDDHVDPPTKAQLTPDGGKHVEQVYRTYSVLRARFTKRAVTQALARREPTILLRGQVETSCLALTPVRCFGEFDIAVIYPADVLPPDPAVAAELISGTGRAVAPGAAPTNPGGLIAFGDAKSWRQLGRLDNGDKRAKVAVQLAVYLAAARTTWAPDTITPDTVTTAGLVINPPGSGGLAQAKLTRIDVSDALRALTAAAAGGADTVTAASPALQAAVEAGARLDHPDDTLARQAVHTLLELGSWMPGCLSLCPLGRTCRRHARARDQVLRIGPAAAAAAPVTSLTRLHQLADGASPTPSEADVAGALRAARALLGPPRRLPWPSPAVAAEEPTGRAEATG